MNKLIRCISLCAVCVSSALSETIRVPSDAQTIQSALDMIHTGDTVLVAPGRYLEALDAPAIHFALIGEPDSSTGEIPTITTQGLANGDSLNCLFLPDSSYATIESLRFTTGFSDVVGGGMAIRSRAAFAIRNCVIDSVRTGINKPCCFDSAFVEVTDCTIRNTVVNGIYALSYTVRATRCSFENAFGLHHCTVGDGSEFRDCTFDGTASFAAIVMNGDPMTMTGCTFSGGGGAAGILHIVQGLGQVLIQNNTFENCSASSGVLRARASVRDGFIIDGNSFVDCRSNGGTIDVTSGDFYRPGRGGAISGNVFINCVSQGAGGGKGVKVDADVTIEGNEFIETEADPFNLSTINVLNGDDVWIQENDFIGSERALLTTAEQTVHAENNWWGDNSGPYHETLNPSGTGATITGEPIDFDPWVMDTTSGIGVTPFPVVYHFNVFPNPFNSSVTIEYALSREQDVRLEVYDILGRQVESLLRERQGIGVHSVLWKADGVASGLYFARLSSREGVAQTVKLMLLK